MTISQQQICQHIEEHQFINSQEAEYFFNMHPNTFASEIKLLQQQSMVVQQKRLHNGKTLYDFYFTQAGALAWEFHLKTQPVQIVQETPKSQ